MSGHQTSGPCHRCGRSGHLARKCSLHICFRCNGRGHMAWECVEGITCSRCGERGHLQRNCKNVSCHKCGRKGHISKFCNDPFVKAEQVERNERHQAILKSRIAFGQGSGKGEFVSLARNVFGSSGTQKAAPGPWDGLGDLGQDRNIPETQASGARGANGKTGTNKSEGGMIGNVKILSVKRKIYPEADMDSAKRLPLQDRGEVERDIGGDPLERSLCIDTLKVDEPLEWNGLLGYGSEDSRDDFHVSSDGEGEEQNCNLIEHAQLELEPNVCEDSSDIKTCADERNDSQSGFQSSVELEPTSVDERYCSATGLQPSIEQEPTDVDERYGSAIGLQPIVEQEQTGIDERYGSATSFQPSVEQEPTGIDERNASAIDVQPGVDRESVTGVDC